MQTVVLVEGASDQTALLTLAKRRGRDLAAEGIDIVPIGGAKNITQFLTRFGPHGADLGVAGLCDAGEERDFRRGLERAGVGPVRTRSDMEAHRFFVCEADLEDELIRSLGVEQVEQVVAAQGEIESFRTFQKQPFQRERSDAARLRRFMGTRSGRKVHYARVLVEALDLTDVPRPLDGLLAAVPAPRPVADRRADSGGGRRS
jgi:hypothetical protein